MEECVAGDFAPVLEPPHFGQILIGRAKMMMPHPITWVAEASTLPALIQADGHRWSIPGFMSGRTRSERLGRGQNTREMLRMNVRQIKRLGRRGRSYAVPTGEQVSTRSTAKWVDATNREPGSLCFCGKERER